MFEKIIKSSDYVQKLERQLTLTETRNEDLKNSVDFNSSDGLGIGDIHMVQCPVCGMEFGLTLKWREHLHDTSQRFYCPNGHSLNFIKRKNTNNVIRLVK